MTRDMRNHSRSWKVKTTAAAAVVAAGVAGGAVLASQHSSVQNSAAHFGLSGSGSGAMLESAVANIGHSGMRSHAGQQSLHMLASLHGFRGQFNFGRHHSRTMAAFERGQIVLITHHFLIVRSKHGQLTAWSLSGRTMVRDVAMTATTQATVPATVPMVTTPVAAQAVTGGTPVAAMLTSTTPVQTTTTTISVTVGTTTVTITVTGAAAVAPTATVTTPTTTTTVPAATATPTVKPTTTVPATTVTPTPTSTVPATTVTPTPTSTVPATTVTPTAKPTTTVPATTAPAPMTTTTVPTSTLTWHGLAAGDLVLVVGTVRHHVHQAQLVLIEALGGATATPTVTPRVITPSGAATSPAAVPSAGPTHF